MISEFNTHRALPLSAMRAEILVTLATSGIMNATFLVVSSLLCLAMYKAGLGVQDIFLLVAAIGVGVSLYMRQLDQDGKSTGRHDS